MLITIDLKRKLSKKSCESRKYFIHLAVTKCISFAVWHDPLAVYPVVRNKGHFGNVSVFWVLDPPLSGDVSPLQGNITFEEGERLKNITLFSVPDEVRIKIACLP